MGTNFTELENGCCYITATGGTYVRVYVSPVDSSFYAEDIACFWDVTGKSRHGNVADLVTKVVPPVFQPTVSREEYKWVVKTAGGYQVLTGWYTKEAVYQAHGSYVEPILSSKRIVEG